jgi:hypothetical protein
VHCDHRETRRRRRVNEICEENAQSFKKKRKLVIHSVSHKEQPSDERKCRPSAGVLPGEEARLEAANGWDRRRSLLELVVERDEGAG